MVWFGLQCPIDARKVLSENLVVIGGTSMLPGFLHRLLAEIRHLVEKPKYSNVLASKSFRIHSPPAKPNCTAWLGGQRWGFFKWSFESGNLHDSCLLTTVQVLYLGHFRTSWAAGLCHGTTTTRQVAFQTGVAWASLLLNPCTKQERPLLHSWREPFPQRSRLWYSNSVLSLPNRTPHSSSVTYCYV